jgi:proteic killer suppression protein
VRFRFASTKLEAIYATEAGFRSGVRLYGESVARSFIQKMAIIRAVTSERELGNFKSLHFEKLKGNRKHQQSIRLNDQFRLILEVEKDERGRLLLVVTVEDYHR